MPLNHQKFIIESRLHPLNINLEINVPIAVIVGENGSGKSRLLESLKTGEASVKIEQNTPHSRGIKTEVQYKFLNFGKCDYDHNESLKKRHKDVNDILDKTNQVGAVMEEEDLIVEDLYNEEDGIWETSAKSKKIPKRFGKEFGGVEELSEGTNHLYELLYWHLTKDIIEESENPEKYKTSNLTPYTIIGLEEPERNLHPRLQKELGAELMNWLKSKNKIKTNLLLIITTHSPYILKGLSKQRHVKVYGLKDGKQVDLTGREDSNTAKIGVTPKLAILQANKMIGSGIGDLFPSPLILAETSIINLIQSSLEKLGVKDDAYHVTSRGDNNIESKLDDIDTMIEMLLFLHKDFPSREMFNLEINVIVDDVEKMKVWKQKYSQKKGSLLTLKFYSIGEKQLEDIYPSNLFQTFVQKKFPEAKDWNAKEQSISKYLFEELKIADKDQGMYKSELSTWIGRNIKSSQDLRQRFPSIYNLLRELKMI